MSSFTYQKQISPIKAPSVPMVVVICCGCCFLQSTIAFVILLPNIYIRRCYISINFALMQFCLSVTATMSFIILSLLKFLPQVSRTGNSFWFNCLFEQCQYWNTSEQMNFQLRNSLNSTHCERQIARNSASAFVSVWKKLRRNLLIPLDVKNYKTRENSTCHTASKMK